MDKKQLNRLNPKLKEVYDRVMGTSLQKQSNNAPKKQVLQPPKTTQPNQPPIPTTAVPKMPPVSITPPQQPIPKPFQIQPVANKQQDQKPQNETGDKKKNKMTPVFIAIGVIVFVLLYTLIWIKLFSLDVPFL